MLEYFSKFLHLSLLAGAILGKETRSLLESSRHGRQALRTDRPLPAPRGPLARRPRGDGWAIAGALRRRARPGRVRAADAAPWGASLGSVPAAAAEGP